MASRTVYEVYYQDPAEGDGYGCELFGTKRRALQRIAKMLGVEQLMGSDRDLGGDEFCEEEEGHEHDGTCAAYSIVTRSVL